MYSRLAIACAIAFCSSLTLSACTTSNGNGEYASKKNHLTQDFLIDAKRDERPNLQNQVQLSVQGEPVDRKITLADAVRIRSDDGFRLVNYPINNALDKGNPTSPFHQNQTFNGFYHPPTYRGIDKWVLEKGADVNASIEYWLAMDTMERVAKGEIRHPEHLDRIGHAKPRTNAYGRKIRSGVPTYYHDSIGELNNLLEDLHSYGVDDKTALVVSHLCLNKAFMNSMKTVVPEYFESDLLLPFDSDGYKEVKAEYLGYPPPSRGQNNYLCDKLRREITKDERSPFWGDYLFSYPLSPGNSGGITNRTVTQVRLDNPKLEDLYKDLGRVREEGLFAGLLYPERAKMVVVSSMVARNSFGIAPSNQLPYFPDNTIQGDAIRASTWFADNTFAYKADPSWTIGTELQRKMGHRSYSFAGCSVDKTLVSYQGNTAGAFRKFYRCQLGNSPGYAIFSSIRQNFEHNLAHSIVHDRQYQAVFEFSKNMTTDLSQRKDCVDAKYPGLCEKRQPELLQELIKGKQDRFALGDAVAYTQVSPEGKVEGVVLFGGFEVVYDLTDIAHWYQNYNPQTPRQYKTLMARFDFGNALHYEDVTYEKLAASPDGVTGNAFDEESEE